MPKETFKDPVEKKFDKVSIYLSVDEKQALLDAIGDRKLSAVLRLLIIQFLIKEKAKRNGSKP
jgi:hypothetical protein